MSLGEISQHIIQIYKRLHETKEALYIEREKLITHLQISHEGLGIFTKDKKEILVNNLFTQYSNLISDSNLETTEEVFAISELKDIIHFINKNQQQRSRGKDEKRMSVTINKTDAPLSWNVSSFRMPASRFRSMTSRRKKSRYV